MMKKLVLIPLIFIMVIALIFGGCAKPAPTEAKTVQIGFIGTLTGRDSDIMKIGEQGAQLAKEWINDQGGITVNGEKYFVELLVEDTKSSPEGAKAAATKLVYDDGVKFTAGLWPPHFSTAAASVTEPAGVLHALMGSCGTREEYGPDTPYRFLCSNATIVGWRSIFTHLTEYYPEVKTIAFILVDDGQVPKAASNCTRIAKEFGLTLKGDIIAWPYDTVDFSPYATIAVNRDADSIMTGNGPTVMTGSILKAAREMGYTKPIFGCNYNPPADILTVAGKENSTNFFTHGISEDAPGMSPLLQEIVKRAVAKYGRLDVVQLYGFNTIYLMVQAIEAAQSFDPTVVRDTWEKMDTIDTAEGPGRMGGLQDHGIRHTAYHRIPIQALENGKVVDVRWVETEQVYAP